MRDSDLRPAGLSRVMWYVALLAWFVFVVLVVLDGFGVLDFGMGPK